MDKKFKEALGITFNGSVTFNGPMFDIHDNEHVYIHTKETEGKASSNDPIQTLPKGERREAEASEQPEVLTTEKACHLLEAARKEGWLDENNQPCGISCTEQALLAKKIGERLTIADVWRTFGNLWNIKPETLRAYYNRALEQKKSLVFQDLLKNAIA